MFPNQKSYYLSYGYWYNRYGVLTVCAYIAYRKIKSTNKRISELSLEYDNKINKCRDEITSIVNNQNLSPDEALSLLNRVKVPDVSNYNASD